MTDILFLIIALLIILLNHISFDSKYDIIDKEDRVRISNKVIGIDIIVLILYLIIKYIINL